MVIDLVSKFIEETRGHPLNVTVSEAQLLHDFATWVDGQAAQQSFALDGVPLCACKKFIPLEDNPEFCAVCKKPRRK